MSSYTGQFDDASEDENERHGERGMGPGGVSHRFGLPGTPNQRLHHQAAGMPPSMLFGAGESPDARSRGMSTDAAFMSMVQNHRAGFGATAHAGLYAQQQQQQAQQAAALSAAQQAARFPHGASAAYLQQQQQQAQQYQRMAAAGAYGASPGELASLRYQRQQEAAAARQAQAHAEVQAARAEHQQLQQQSPYGRVPHQRASPGSPDHRAAQSSAAAAARYAEHGSYYGQQQRGTPQQAAPPYMSRGGAAESPYAYAGRGGAPASVEASVVAARQAQYKQGGVTSPHHAAGGAGVHHQHGLVGGGVDRSTLHHDLVAAGPGGAQGSPSAAAQQAQYRAAPPPQDRLSAKAAQDPQQAQQHVRQSPVSPVSISAVERTPLRGGPGRGMGRGSGSGGGGRGGGKPTAPTAAPVAAAPVSVPAPAPAPSPEKEEVVITSSVGTGTEVASPVKSSSPPPQPQEEAPGPPPEWCNGHAALGLDEDKYWLSELQCFLRSQFAEAFGASERDIVAPMHGRNKPIVLGQVGIRCVWCRDLPYERRSQQAVSYPSLVTGIYNSVQQMYRLHFDCCAAMPHDVRKRIETLRKSSSSRGGRKQYWVDSAKRLGLADTPHGITFARDPSLPPPPAGALAKKRPPKKGTAAAAELEAARGKKATPPADGDEKGGEEELPPATKGVDKKELDEPLEGAAPDNDKGADPKSDLEPDPGPDGPSPDEAPTSGKPAPQSGGKKAVAGRPMTDLDWAEAVKKQKEDSYPLVLPEDKPLISDYLYLTLEQMEPCSLMDADRVGCYKGRAVGFRGLACRHCVGQAGCGRYFPASEASLSQTTTSQTILNHVRNCRRCPIEIRESLELMKRAKMGPGGRNGKPKHGGRKVFFHRLWCRIQKLPIDEDEDVEVKIGRQKGAKNKMKEDGDDDEDDEEEETKKSSRASKRKRFSSDSDSDSDKHRKKANAPYNSDEDSESDDEDEDGNKVGKRSRRKDALSDDDDSDEDDDDSTVGEPPSWFEGSAPLSRSDDPHWLSELHCFLRSDMVEAFSAAEEDLGTGQPRNEAVEVGQVGIRCRFCASPSGEHPTRPPKGHVYFPPSLVAIHQAATDLHRRHFISCPEMPEDVRATMRSLKSFGAKAEGDTLQYWIDSAREMGLSESPDGIGLRFYRDPLAPSPADDIVAGPWPKSFFVREEEDKGLVTDQAALLLMQVRPCRFKTSDKRGGPGSRGRDRTIGFPGLACSHCAKKNNYGRYFPVAAKSLADNAANSVMTHLSNCRRCPEAIKSTLAYLAHRAVLQKAEMGGGWKRTFYKKVWDRLHHERNWDAASGEGDNTAAGLQQKDGTEAGAGSGGEGGGADDDDATAKSGMSNGGSEEVDDEAVVNEMGDLIKAAAVWLTERDAAEAAQAVRTRGGRGRGLPTKRFLSPAGGGRAGRGRAGGAGAGEPSVKRSRRVHF